MRQSAGGHSKSRLLILCRGCPRFSPGIHVAPNNNSSLAVHGNLGILSGCIPTKQSQTELPVMAGGTTSLRYGQASGCLPSSGMVPGCRKQGLLIQPSEALEVMEYPVSELCYKSSGNVPDRACSAWLLFVIGNYR